jgi:6-phosphogluconolactonase
VSYAWDGTHGRVDFRGAISTLPEGFPGEDMNTTGEVAVHPSGRFVYGSNRGHDSIAAFRVSEDRTLTRVDIYSAGGKTPRHFAIDPGGGFLLAANQESHSLVLFRIEQETGALIDTGARASALSPAFVGIPLRR